MLVTCRYRGPAVCSCLVTMGPFGLHQARLQLPHAWSPGLLAPRLQLHNDLLKNWTKAYVVRWLSLYADLFAHALYKTRANKLTDLDLAHFQILWEPRTYQEASTDLSNLSRDFHPQPLPVARELCVSSAPRAHGPVWGGGVCLQPCLLGGPWRCAVGGSSVVFSLPPPAFEPDWAPWMDLGPGDWAPSRPHRQHPSLPGLGSHLVPGSPSLRNPLVFAAPWKIQTLNEKWLGVEKTATNHNGIGESLTAGLDLHAASASLLPVLPCLPVGRNRSLGKACKELPVNFKER